uniref:Olfactory receptor 7E24-like n=1 Tax=Castor canadensis TaxID=51338 RepID=A0A8B7TVC1_CASCN
FKKCNHNDHIQNLTIVSEFHLLGISDDPDLQPILSGLFLSMYLVTVLGNLLIILAVISDSHLHTPMYFFLCNLSATDICFISTMVPKVIINIETHSTVISYVGCLAQMSLFIIFGCMDDMLLTVVAYDQFLAICYPLHYSVIMNPHLCVLLVLLSFFISLLDSLLHNFIPLQFPYFKDVEISNFFCDPSQVLNLACSDAFTNKVVIGFVVIISGFLPISGIFISYYKTVSSILIIPSSVGKCNTFTTCGSHLSIVCLFYGTGFGVYLSSAISHSPRNCALASVISTVITPMLNPFIYSLRNRDIKNTLRHLRMCRI